VIINSYREYKNSLNYYKSIECLPLLQEGVVYHCSLNDAKRRNLARQAINKTFLRWKEIARPHIIHVGVTTCCNLSCPACALGTGDLGRPLMHLDYSIFCRMVDELRDSLLFMLFWDWGEPFLHPRLWDMIEYVNKSQIMSVTSTNLSMNLDDRSIEKIVTCGLNHLIVCIEGATQEVHESYRRGSQLDIVLDNFRRIVAAKDRFSSHYPMIEIRTLATRQNETQLSQLLDLASDYGAQMYSVKTFRPFDYRGHNLDQQVVPTNKLLARYEYKNDVPNADGRIQEKMVFNCGKPFYAPTLNSDGNLAFCSYVDQPEEIFGDIREGFSNVWEQRSSRLKRLNFGKMEGTYTCKKCYFRNFHKPTVRCTIPLDSFPPALTLEKRMTKEEFLELLNEE